VPGCHGPSEAAPRTAKSVGTPNGPCGFLSASSGSRRDSRPGAADRRHPLRRIRRPKPRSPSLCHPSWLVRRSKRLCGSGRDQRYALLGTWLKCQSSRDQGSLGMWLCGGLGSGGGGEADDLVAGGEASGHLVSVLGCGESVASGSEVRGYSAERGQEPLRMPR
jgi:hypothetical protein